MDVMAHSQFWITTGLGLWALLKQMVIIVIPLMLFMQIISDLNILDRITKWLAWTVKPFSMPEAAVFPLLVGLVFGLAYGAGLIIQAAREETLGKRDLYLISLFLVINHSAIEDTLLFAAVGAKGWLVLLVRFIASYVVTGLTGKFLLPVEKVEAL